MDLGLKEQTVTREDFDYTISFETDGGYEIRIENDYTLTTAAGVVRFSPGPGNANSGPLTDLVGKLVESSETDINGTLILIFNNGSILRAEASESYESWTVAGPDGYKVVCMPGGELSVWQAD